MEYRTPPDNMSMNESIPEIWMTFFISRTDIHPITTYIISDCFLYFSWRFFLNIVILRIIPISAISQMATRNPTLCAPCNTLTIIGVNVPAMQMNIAEWSKYLRTCLALMLVMA